MIPSRLAAVWVLGLFLTLAAASVMAAPRVLVPIPRVPSPSPTAQLPKPVLKNGYVGAVAPGSIVSLARLPNLPPRRADNTATTAMLRNHRVHPMAANGAYISLAGTTQANCDYTLGTYTNTFAIGCTLTLQAEGMPATDTLQDYAITPSSANEQSGAATALGATYSGPAGVANNYTLAAAGTYIFGTYDVTTSQWEAIIYVNAGSVFSIKVYQDALHTEEAYQFSASNSPAAYIYLEGVSASDSYVMAVNQTAVSPNCVFMVPAPTPAPPAAPTPFPLAPNQLCNYSISSGIQAPGGNLAFTWPIASTLAGGTYSIEIYDATVHQRLGQVQVSITNAGGTVMTMYPDAHGPNANAMPAPLPVVSATPSSIIAWNGGAAIGAQDESVTGVTGYVSGVKGSTPYTWTLVDPDGVVVGQTSATTFSNTVAVSYTVVFDQLDAGPGGLGYIFRPGRYPSKTWAMQLYDASAKRVLASQSFQILGYTSKTEFNSGGILGATLPLTASSTVNGTLASLRITNNGNLDFDGLGDNLSSLAFTTGPDFGTSGTGSGVFVSTNQTSLCNTTCTAAAFDQSGNSWNVNIACSNSTLSTTGYCSIQATPMFSTITLPPGGYLQIDNLYWFMASGAGCGTSCIGSTSELPQHGLRWSCVPGFTGCPAGGRSLAYGPAYFTDAGSRAGGTAQLTIIGSVNQGTPIGNFSSTPPAPPYTGPHWYQSYFQHGNLVLDSPFPLRALPSVPADNIIIGGWYLTNTSTGTPAANYAIQDVAITYPGSIRDQALAYYFFTMTNIGCPGFLPTPTYCFQLNTPIQESGSSNPQMIWTGITPPLMSVPPEDARLYACIGASPTACSWTNLKPANGTVSSIDGAFPALDTMSLSFFSLIGSDMSASFSPSSVGTTNPATMGFQYTNTSLGVDANPDSIDAIVLEGPSGATTTLDASGAMYSKAGWSYLGSFTLSGSSYTQYWFGVCPAQFTNGAQQGNGVYGGPDQAQNSPAVLTASYGAAYPSLGLCPAAKEHDAILPGNSLTVNRLRFSNLNSGIQNWHMYAHGANTGGWSSGQNMFLKVLSESAKVWFNQINGVTQPGNTVPIIGGSPNSYEYAVSNNGASSINTVDIELPGTDINRANATDSSGHFWQIPNIDTSGTITLYSGPGKTGTQNPYGCSVNLNSSKTYNATAAGASGIVEINCTSFNAGSSLYVELPNTTISPSTDGAKYLFPTTVDGIDAGAQWLGSDEVDEKSSLGLDVVVDPSNPGPGGSVPIVNCATSCAFSGGTVDVGNLPGNFTGQFTDVIRASITYSGSGTGSLQLYVSASQNPLNSLGAPVLSTAVDQAHSSTAAGMTFLTTSYTNVPTTGAGIELGTAPETTNPSYDFIESLQLKTGSEQLVTHIVTLTYSVIAT